MRRSCLVLSAVALACAGFASSAQGYVAHSVAPGESLWSIAQRDGLSVQSLAAANGLSSWTQLRSGGVIAIPGSVGVSRASVATEGPDDVAEGAGTGPIAARSPSPPPLGAYIVRPGDTLSGIAARSRVTASQIAFMNGVSLRSALRIGTVLKLPTGAPVVPTTPPPVRRVIPLAPPYATPGRVTGSQVGQIAIRNGVPASFAKAIAWQESGFNNAAVSSANARGVMQILPGTWRWIQTNLTTQRLNPNSAFDNVTAGTLYLHSLLRSTGGSVPRAAASYYQGLGSVQRNGPLPETRRYVNSVLSLRSRFLNGL